MISTPRHAVLRRFVILSALIAATLLPGASATQSRTVPNGGAADALAADTGRTSCAAAIARTRDTYGVLAELKVTRVATDERAARLVLTIEGLSRPVALDFADAQQEQSMVAYASYLRERVGASEFDAWTGASETDPADVVAEKLVKAQKAAALSTARRALAGEIRILIHDEASVWLPTPRPGASYQIMTFDDTAAGCMPRRLGGSVDRAALTPALQASLDGALTQ
jgi:hypothetical protein